MRPEYKTIQGTEKSQNKIDDKLQSLKFDDKIGKNVKTVAEVIFYMICNKTTTHINITGNKRIQCVGSRRRSADDIYRVAKSYVKDITLDQIKESLSILVNKRIIQNHYCNIINKTVHISRNVIPPTLNRIQQFVKI